jgi:molybdopterin synthase sulfur carrier subunit
VSTDALPVTGPLTLSDVVRRAVALHPGTRLPNVLEACSVLVGDQPVASRRPDDVLVEPGQIVEFLPPFAGG